MAHGQGVLESPEKPKRVREALHFEQYEGAVRMGETGIVLNTRRIAAVVPLHRLRLVEGGREAEWQGRSWAVSQVPQRCWDYDGRLVTEKNPMSDSPALISTEDVSRIGQQINRDGAPPGEVVFRPVMPWKTRSRTSRQPSRRFRTGASNPARGGAKTEHGDRQISPRTND